MNYRSTVINKKKKNTQFILFYSFLFIVVIAVSGYYYLNIKHSIYNLKTNRIPTLKKQLNIIKNSIAVENRNNSNLIRNSIKVKAEELGMSKAEYSNIIDVWWEKENN